MLIENRILKLVRPPNEHNLYRGTYLTALTVDRIQAQSLQGHQICDEHHDRIIS